MNYTSSDAEWPELGDLVVATAKRIESYGAYVTLDEYGNKEGLLHISEISTRWVRNVRNHVREGQKLVLLVHRMDREKGQINLSLKRVGKSEYKEKMEDFKKDQRARTLLSQAAKLLNIPEVEFYKQVEPPLLDKYRDLYDGLEEVTRKGSDILTKLGISDEIAETLSKLAVEKIKIKMFKAQGVLNVTSQDPKGIIIIREALVKMKKMAKKKKMDVEIYTVGAPKYRVELSADDHKKLDSSLKELVDEVVQDMEKSGGSASFVRE